MQLTLDERSNANLIQALDDTQVRIRGQIYTTSVIVTATAVHPDWPVRAVSALDDVHWQQLLATPPQILLLGTGTRIEFPSARQLSALTNARIGVEVMDSAAACRTFNVLLGEGRSVAAALILPGAVAPA